MGILFFWWETNVNLMPMCPNHKICNESAFISQVCHLAPIKLLTVNLDQILALTLGKLLYDPWLSQNTKVIVVSRDPRGIIFDRDQNCAQHHIVSQNLFKNHNLKKSHCLPQRLKSMFFEKKIE